MNSQTSLDNSVADKSVELLVQQLASIEGNCLVVADENWGQANWASIANNKPCSISLISNRFDIARSAAKAGLSCQFSDFDFSTLAPKSFDTVVYRVSKERASNHHIINQAGQLLKPGGSLWLSGEKNEGIKTYVKQACALFGDRTHAEKRGVCYRASVQLVELLAEPLDDKQYPSIRFIELPEGSSFYSKPGIFGWDKLDRGSTFLIDHLPQFLTRFSRQPQSLLDLGCGYGYLAWEGHRLGITQLTATDNNAAALAAAEKNLSQIDNLEYSVVAADAGDLVQGNFDLLLCNPPFHQGFTVDGSLGNKFLNSANRLLAPNGQALFVVNSFIPLEQRATHFFRQVEVLANNGSFKLVAMDNH
ncbi:MAG: methyltransferase [Porticoccaceae bacterium]